MEQNEERTQMKSMLPQSPDAGEGASYLAAVAGAGELVAAPSTASLFSAQCGNNWVTIDTTVKTHGQSNKRLYTPNYHPLQTAVNYIYQIASQWNFLEVS